MAIGKDKIKQLEHRIKDGEILEYNINNDDYKVAEAYLHECKHRIIEIKRVTVLLERDEHIEPRDLPKGYRNWVEFTQKYGANSILCNEIRSKMRKHMMHAGKIKGELLESIENLNEGNTELLIKLIPILEKGKDDSENNSEKDSAKNNSEDKLKNPSVSFTIDYSELRGTVKLKNSSIKDLRGVKFGKPSRVRKGVSNERE